MILGALLLAGGAVFALKRLLGPSEPAPGPDSPDAGPAGPSTATEPAAAPPDPAEVEREINHYLAFSALSMGLTGAGALFFPPISILGAAGVLYTSWPIFERAYVNLVKDKRIRVSLLDSVAVSSVLLGGFYFVGALSNTGYFLGRKLLHKTESQSRVELANMFGEQSRTVWIVQDGIEIEIPIEQLCAGDLVVVGAGQAVPVDGVIKSGAVSIDQHLLTGEAQPVEKEAGAAVFATTVVLSGRAYIEVKEAGAETLVAQISTILNRTADYRSVIEARSETLADRSVPWFLGLSALALLQVSPEGAITILNGNFIDSARVAMPLGMLNFLKAAASRSILIKDGRALELLTGVDTVVFDKTGTLTLSQPHVGEIHSCGAFSKDTLLAYAATAEARQSHPIAKAIVSAAAERSLLLPDAGHVRLQVGLGIQAEIGGQRIRVGSARFMAMEGIAIPESFGPSQVRAQERGYSLVFVSIGDALGGVLELRPTVRPEARQVIAALQTRGLKVRILSGDQEAPTRHLAAALGIDTYHADVLPTDKAALVAALQSEGRKVCFIGDGVNDSIALKTATCSVSLNGASGLAVDTAQIVLIDGTLKRLPELFELAQSWQSNMRMTMFTSIAPAAFLVGGVFFLNFGIYISVILFNISLAASVANAMRPTLLKESKPRQIAS